MTIFTPKSFFDITADMIEHVRGSTDKLTDFNVGSVTRSLLEADAIELDDYYQAVYSGLTKAIPTAIYLGFGFDLRPAVAASGWVQVQRVTEGEIRVPAGTVFQSLSGNDYRLQEEFILLEGEDTAWGHVHALVAGLAGNDGVGAISVNNGLYTVSSPYLLAGGQDVETDEQRALRFAAFIRSLARGTNAALEYAAGLPTVEDAQGQVIERVQRSAVSEEPGHVYLYIHNGSYGATDGLVAKVQSVIDGYRSEDQSWIGGYRPAGMRVEVQPMIETAFNVHIEVARSAFHPESTVSAAVQTAIASKVRATLPGEAIRPVDLINAALSVEGVDGANVLSPLQTIYVADHVIYYLDNFDVSWIT